MRRSTDRILTTHAGSLPREEDLAAMIRRKAQGEVLDEGAFFARVKKAVSDAVRRACLHRCDLFPKLIG